MIDPNHVLRVGAATDLYVEQLQAKVAELTATLKDHGEIQAALCQQLAIAEEHNARLQDALKAVIKVHGYESGIPVEALAQPSDTFALDAYVAEKAKDSESRTGNQSPCYTIARDMAVRMWEKHYKTDAPSWEPLDDFMGVLSQISNMLTGLGNVEKITRQRDLAVEALEWAADVLPPSDPGGIGGCDCPVCRALETIKESEAK